MISEFERFLARQGARLVLGPLALISAAVIGCAPQEGAVSGVQPKEAAVAQQAAPVRFRYAPPDATYHYVLTTVTNPGDPSALTTEQHYLLKVHKHADRYLVESTIQKSLVNGKPRQGVTAADYKAFKLTTVLNTHGAIQSAQGQATRLFVGPGAKDLGTSFELPSQPLRPGDTWSRERGAGGNRYTIKFTFVGIQLNGAQRIATFEERASGGHGETVAQPTLINIDADSGMLIDKVAVTTIPTGPSPSDPAIPERSEIRMVAGSG